MCFVKNFCTYVHKRYWSIILFICFISCTFSFLLFFSFFTLSFFPFLIMSLSNFSITITLTTYNNLWSVLCMILFPKFKPPFSIVLLVERFMITNSIFLIGKKLFSYPIDHVLAQLLCLLFLLSCQIYYIEFFMIVSCSPFNISRIWVTVPLPSQYWLFSYLSFPI